MRLPALLTAVLTAAAAVPALAAEVERQKTAAGVQATEDHWSAAFVGGDEAYLNSLLDDAYLSVSSSGKARPKAEIIALARKVAAMPKQAYDKPQSHIDVRGDTAIVTFAGKTDVSVDVFQWRAGAWHAWYSQRTSPYSSLRLDLDFTVSRTLIASPGVTGLRKRRLSRP